MRILKQCGSCSAREGKLYSKTHCPGVEKWLSSNATDFQKVFFIFKVLNKYELINPHSSLMGC